MNLSLINRAGEALTHRLSGVLPDGLYLRLLYFFHMGKSLHLNKPKLFSEKLQWLKLNNRDSRYTVMVDKIAVKDYVKSVIGEKYIIPTYAVWDSVDDINIDSLPESFVLKCNHYGGNCGVYVVADKSKFDLQTAKRGLLKTLKSSIYRNYREWPYKNVQPRIFAEKFLAENIDDYKFFCFDGFVESVLACYDRGSGSTKFYFFDKDWNLKRYNVRGKQAPADFTTTKPKNVEEMFDIASRLSKGIPFVRVDLYNVNGRIYFGEMTFYPASGFDENILPEADVLLGSYLELPEKRKR